jgi:hypothetical protein
MANQDSVSSGVDGPAVSALSDVPDLGAADADALDRGSLGLTAGNLRSAQGPLISVTPQATIDQAITLMLLNDYSQLAIMTGSRSLHGAVSWKSISQARNVNPAAALADAIIRVPEARYDQELIELLPLLRAYDFVLVKDQANAWSGIITTTDVVDTYGELATPFMLIGALDQSLRRVISSRFELADVIGLCDPDGQRGVEAMDDLSFGDYQRILENQECWARLSWSLDRGHFIARLNDIREMRNDVMHFNPDPLPEDAIGMLRNLLVLLDQYGS